MSHSGHKNREMSGYTRTHEPTCYQTVLCHCRNWVGLKRGPLSLVSTTEDLLERKISDSGLENREYGCRDPSSWPRGILYPQKLALTWPTSGSRSFCIVHSRTQTTEFVCLFVCLFCLFVCLYSRVVPVIWVECANRKVLCFGGNANRPYGLLSYQLCLACNFKTLLTKQLQICL
jgi:hypothetical protein